MAKVRQRPRPAGNDDNENGAICSENKSTMAYVRPGSNADVGHKLVRKAGNNARLSIVLAVCVILLVVAAARAILLWHNNNNNVESSSPNPFNPSTFVHLSPGADDTTVEGLLQEERVARAMVRLEAAKISAKALTPSFLDYDSGRLALCRCWHFYTSVWNNGDYKGDCGSGSQCMNTVKKRMSDSSIPMEVIGEVYALLKTRQHHSAVFDKYCLEAMTSTPSRRAGVVYSTQANYGQLAVNHLCSRGWEWVTEKELFDAHSIGEKAMLWRITPSSIDYNALLRAREDGFATSGANMLPDSFLTAKDAMWRTLRDWSTLQDEKASSKKQKGACREAVVTNLSPETFDLSDEIECETFIDVFEKEQNDATFLIKPVNAYGGTGIKIVGAYGAGVHTVSRELCLRGRYVAQRYLDNPLLLDGRKFDIRVYAFVARVAPKDRLLAYYHQGHARVNVAKYETDGGVAAHLTNTNIQKHLDEYRDNDLAKEDHNWSLEALKDHLRDLGEPGRRAADNLVEHMKKAMTTAIVAAAPKWENLDMPKNTFQFFGFDFMMTNDLKLWLIEANKNSALAPTSTTKRSTTLPLVREALDVTLKMWDASADDEPGPLINHNNGTLEVLVDGDWKFGFVEGCE